MKLLGLDISTKTGAVVIEGDTSEDHEVLYSGKLTTKATEVNIERAAIIAGMVVNLIETYSPDEVWMESYAVVNYGKSTTTLIEVGALIRLAVFQSGLPFYEVTPTALKKYVTGSGVGPKDVIVKEVFKRWGFDTPDNDIADAFGIAEFGMAVRGKGIQLPTPNNDAIKAWLKPPVKKKKRKAK